MRYLHLTTLTIVLLSLGFGGLARAETIYVPDDYPTIQAAIDAAVDGDEIVVRDGTYAGPGNKDLDFGGNPITVRSENGPDCCTIDCEGEGRGFYFHTGETDTSVVVGFRITHGNPGLYGGAVFCDGSSPDGSSPTVVNCKFIDNSAGHGGGMANNNSSPTVVNCLFCGNTVAGHGGGMENVNSNPVVTNCTFTRNQSSTQPDGGMINHDSNPVLTNCILWGDIPGEMHNTGSSNPIVTYCDVEGGYPGEGNIDDNPLFVNAGACDLHLSLGSPCIDAGDTSVLPAGLFVDLDGRGRVLDYICTVDTGIPAALVPVTVDMGAYEFYLSGDLDIDGDVDLSDLAELLAHYGEACSGPHEWDEYQWFSYGEHWYALTLDGPVSWSAAEAEAEAIGGTLVNINDQAEQDWLSTRFPYPPDRPWIGLWQDPNDPDYSEPGGGWKWICGDPLTFTNWAPGEPNEAPPPETNEDRAQMNAFGPGLWQDVPGDSYFQRGIIEVSP